MNVLMPEITLSKAQLQHVTSTGRKLKQVNVCVKLCVERLYNGFNIPSYSSSFEFNLSNRISQSIVFLIFDIFVEGKIEDDS